MRLPETLPTVEDGRMEAHILDVPPCCPVSKNPRPGSKLIIRYKPAGKVLEVASLYAYLHQYKGGLRDESGNLLVRDMEGMISLIAQHCSECGTVRKKDLSERWHSCECGCELDRDTNAAINILHKHVGAGSVPQSAMAVEAPAL